MRRKDTAVLIDLLRFNIVHTTPAGFQYFFQSTMVPILVENSNFLVYLFVETLLLWLWLKYNTGTDPGEFKGFHGIFLFWQTLDITW